jgi:hypothetical protein
MSKEPVKALSFQPCPIPDDATRLSKHEHQPHGRVACSRLYAFTSADGAQSACGGGPSDGITGAYPKTVLRSHECKQFQPQSGVMSGLESSSGAVSWDWSGRLPVRVPRLTEALARFLASGLSWLRALDKHGAGVTSLHPSLLLAILTVGCQGRLWDLGTGAMAVPCRPPVHSSVVKGHALQHQAMAVRCPSRGFPGGCCVTEVASPSQGGRVWINHQSDSKILASSKGRFWLRFRAAVLGSCMKLYRKSKC